MIRMELVGVNLDFYPVPLLLSSLALLGPPVVSRLGIILLVRGGLLFMQEGVLLGLEAGDVSGRHSADGVLLGRTMDLACVWSGGGD